MREEIFGIELTIKARNFNSKKMRPKCRVPRLKSSYKRVKYIRKDWNENIHGKYTENQCYAGG